MNNHQVGCSMVVNGCFDFSTAIPFMDMGRALMAIEEIRRGFRICREEHPKECARFLLRFFGLGIEERIGYPTGHWAGANSVLNHRRLGY